MRTVHELRVERPWCSLSHIADAVGHRQRDRYIANGKTSAVRLHTANGITDGKLGRAATVQLRSLHAKDVPIVVEDDAKATFGDGIDGLLGMSFLSRFKVTIDTQAVKISNRQTK